jgi:hypothetical protein
MGTHLRACLNRDDARAKAHNVEMASCEPAGASCLSSRSSSQQPAGPKALVRRWAVTNPGYLNRASQRNLRATLGSVGLLTT